MKSLYLSLLFIFATCQLSAQTTELSRADQKEYKSSIQKAQKICKNDPSQWDTALQLYQKAYQLDSTQIDLCNKLGVAYLASNHKAQALPYFQRSLLLDSTNTNAEAYYHLASCYQLKGDFTTADSLYAYYETQLPTLLKKKKLAEAQKRVSKRRLECTMGDSLTVSNQRYVFKNFEWCNTPKDEYAAWVSPDEKLIVYTQSFYQADQKIETIVSVIKENALRYTPPMSLMKAPKKSNHVAISNLGENELYLYNGNKPGTLYHYSLEKQKWGKTGKLKWKGYKPTKQVYLSKDQQTIYFSAIHKKGMGQEDIYYAIRNAKGKWSKPINMGANINSEYQETAPYVVGDSIMYFASNGKNSIGGYDIMVSVKKDSVWQPAQNLGLSFNTPYDENFYFPYRSTRTYLSSNREGGIGGMDLYHIQEIVHKDLYLPTNQPLSNVKQQMLADVKLQENARIDSSLITVLKGVVMSEDSIPLAAKFELTDNALQQVIAELTTDSLGDFNIQLPGGFNYGVSVSCYGYLFHSENFDLPEQTHYQEIEKNIFLKKIEIGKNVILKNIFFETAKADLSEESRMELNYVIRLLQENPSMHIEISGHTDNQGSRAYNLKLSKKRAESVVNYLVEHGVDAERLTAKGYAFDQPVASNKTKEGRKENRRTEFLVTKL